MTGPRRITQTASAARTARPVDTLRSRATPSDPPARGAGARRTGPGSEAQVTGRGAVAGAWAHADCRGSAAPGSGLVRGPGRSLRSRREAVDGCPFFPKTLTVPVRCRTLL